MYQGITVSFNELMCYWNMEGHLALFDCIDEAYVKALMDTREMKMGPISRHEAPTNPFLTLLWDL